MPESIHSRRRRSESFTLDFDDVRAGQFSLNARSYTAVPMRETEDLMPSNSTSTIASRSLDRYQNDHTAQLVHAQKTKSSNATLTRSAYQRWFSTPFDVIISLVPLLFLIIASLCLSLNKKPVSLYGENLKAATLLSPTIFPIVYAAILGKMLRRVGHFKAERSATIGTLERFIGCQSLFATLERQFGLRRIDFLSVSILLAWLLSPLGGQSSLRLLSTHPRSIVYNSTIQYFPISGFENQTILNLDMPEGDWPQFAPLYMTALQTSRQTLEKPTDLFGNVKIPDVTLLKDFQSISDINVTWYNGDISAEFRRYHPANNTERSSQWYEVPTQSPVQYTSLLGLPVVGVPSRGNSSFNLTSAYWNVRCDPFTYKKGKNVTDIEGLERGPFGPSFAMDLDDWDSQWMNYYETMHYEMTIGSKIEHSEIITARCSATWSFAESHVKCQATACAVEQMRELFKPVNVTHNYSLDILCRHMPGADMGFRQSMTTSSELVEQWIQDPDLKTFMRHNKRFGEREIWVNHTEIPIELFSHRFKMALNTFWDSTLGLQYRMGNLTADAIRNQEDRANNLTWAETNLQGKYFDGEQYACDKTFAIITIVISWFLFMAANVSVILGIVTKAPDILGYVSTCARDNPYFEKYVASHLDGLEAARVLRDVRIIIGDVRRKDDVGHIAFALMDSHPERVNRTRMYD